MRKIALLSSMVLTLMLAVGLVVGDNFTIFVPWFLNDNGGVFQSQFDSWLSFRNVSPNTVTVTVEFFDNSDWALATTVTIELTSGQTRSYDTGTPARNPALDPPWAGYNMGANCDRGNINIVWPEVGANPRADVLGYIVHQTFASQDNLAAQSCTIFLYAD